jgi:chorismate lyase / 3-hydroxybenzoate synthase
MTLLHKMSDTSACTAHVEPPFWVAELLGGEAARPAEAPVGATLHITDSDEFRLVSVCLADAARLRPTEFEHRTADVYRAVARALQSGSSPHPVRIWNYLPQIHAPAGDGLDRYMNFNAGRFAAYRDWFGGTSAFERLVPSASAVGHHGEDLVVHALGSRERGVAIANPRQVAPYHYSRRFGPRPPCFARATALPGDGPRPSLIFVGGTASIRGEDSIHPQSLVRQTQETFDNLAHLIRAAGEGSDGAEDFSAGERGEWLRCFRDLRVYHMVETDRPTIARMVQEAFPPAVRVEYVRADLCRAELLVEIEGLAHGVGIANCKLQIAK